MRGGGGFNTTCCPLASSFVNGFHISEMLVLEIKGEIVREGLCKIIETIFKDHIVYLQFDRTESRDEIGDIAEPRARRCSFLTSELSYLRMMASLNSSYVG